MNIDQLKIMLELQAIKNFNTPIGSQNDNSLFQEIFNDILSEHSLSDTTTNLTENKALDYNNLILNNFNSVNIPINLESISNNVTDNLPQTNYEQIIENAAQKYNIPTKLIKSIIKHESNFNPNVVSHAGASGLMQLMPATARGLGVKNIFDPAENIDGGSKYIRSMIDRYKGDIKLALAAYNAGPGNVDKYKGVPPFKETQNYVRKVLDTFNS